MRKLMWFALGFGGACALCAYCLWNRWSLPLAAAALALGIAVGFFGRNRKPIRKAALVFLGCAVGFAWFAGFQRLYLAPAAALDGETVQITVTAADYSYETAYGSAVDGIVTLEGKPYRIRVYIDEKRELSPGDRLTGPFRLRITTPDGQEETTYHAGMGIFLLGYQDGSVEIRETEAGPWWCFPARLRMRIQLILQDCFPEDTAGFARALLLGDTTGLDYETDTALKISGIRHIAAVSGLHVSILYGLLSVLTGRRRVLTALLGIPALVLFAAVAGFTPSVTRACMMVGLMLLAMLLSREYDPPTELAFAGLVMLVCNPLVITSVSFQLSVASVSGILLFHAGINGWLLVCFGSIKGKGFKAKLARWFSGSVSVTLSAMVFTAPLCAWYFGTVSLIGVVTNLLTLWIVSFIFYGILAVCLLQLVWGSGAVMLARVIAWPIRYVLLIARLLSRVPLAAVYTKSVYIVAWLLFCYGLLVVFLLSKNRRPGILGCCACMGLCLALLCSWAEPMLDDCRVTVLDVGQGQSILLQSQGRTYLVDCGGDSDTGTADTVAETLLSQGIRRLDGIILTHYDRDHTGGLSYLLTRMQTDLLLLPDCEDGGFSDTIPKSVDGAVIRVSENLLLSFGGTELTVYGPVFGGYSNENSLCVLFETENCAILITGDRSDFGERMLLREAELPKVDMLIAGHHGSKYSTSYELLQAVQPETVIISVGADNPYGHPAEELLARLAEFGCAVWRTDENGTIIYRR